MRVKMDNEVYVSKKFTVILQHECTGMTLTETNPGVYDTFTYTIGDSKTESSNPGNYIT